MHDAIKKRFAKGFGANVYGQVVVAIIQLVGVPILLSAWGKQLYGEWLILFAIPSYLSLTDLGFSQSAANDMCARMVRKDEAGALAVFQSLLMLVAGAAALGIIIVSVVLWLLPLQGWLHFAAMDTGQVRWVLWLLAAEVLVRLIGGTNHAGFRAGGEYDFHVAIYYTTLLVQYAAIWFVALLGHGPAIAAAAFLLVRVVATIGATILLLNRQRWLRYGRTLASRAELRRLLKPALANVGLPLAQAVNIQGMVLVVGGVLGPLAVVVFATLRTLARLALQGVLSVSHALEPELAFAWGAGDKPLLRRLYLYGLAASFWLALAAGVVLHFLGSWIVGVWTHHQVAMNMLLFDWLILSSVAGACWYSGLILRKAANRHLRAAIWYVAASLAAVVVAVLALRFTGRLADAGLVLLITDIVMVVYILHTTKRLIGVSAVRILLALIDPRAVVRPMFEGVLRAR